MLLVVVGLLVLLRGVIVAQQGRVTSKLTATRNVPVELKARIPAHLIVVSRTPITRASGWWR